MFVDLQGGKAMGHVVRLEAAGNLEACVQNRRVGGVTSCALGSKWDPWEEALGVCGQAQLLRLGDLRTWETATRGHCGALSVCPSIQQSRDHRKGRVSRPGQARSVWGCLILASVAPLPLREASWTLSLGDQLKGCFGRGGSGHRAKVGRRDLGDGRASNGHSSYWKGRLLLAAAPPSLQALQLSCPL